MRKGIERKFLVFEIIASEFLRFCVSLKETFSKGTTFTVINKFGKGAVIQIETLFRPISHVLCLRVL